MMRTKIAVAALAVLLAACDGGTNGEATSGADEGEVLGGTISDEMLPLDTVRSQSPPLPVQPGSEAASDEPDSAPAEETSDAEEPGQPDDGATVETEAPPPIQLNPAPAPTPAAGEGEDE